MIEIPSEKTDPFYVLHFIQKVVGNVVERDFFNGSSIINRFMGEMRGREGSVTTFCLSHLRNNFAQFSNAEYVQLPRGESDDVSITSKRQKCWPRNSKESNLIKTG